MNTHTLKYLSCWLVLAVILNSIVAYAQNGRLPKAIALTELHNGQVSMETLPDARSAKVRIIDTYNNAATLGIPDPIFPLIGFLGNKSTDSGRGIVVDAGGNTYVTGSTDIAGASYAFLAKYTAGQALESYLTFIPDDPDDPRYISANGNGIALDSEGNIVVAGTILDGTAGDTDAFVVKFTPDAKEIFTRIVGVARNDVGNGVAVNTTNDKVYWTGTYGLSATQTAMFLVALDSSGVQLFGGTIIPLGQVRSTGLGVAVDTNDNVFLAGSATNSLQITSTLGIKFNNPNFIYVVGFDIPDAPSAQYNAVAVNAKGEAVLVGESTIGGVWTKLTPAGKGIWSFYNDQDVQFKSVTLQNKTGIAAFAGYFNRPPFFNNIDALLVRANTSGELIDAVLFDSSEEERAYAITGDGETVYMAGDTRSADFPVNDGSALNGPSDSFVTKIVTNPAFRIQAEFPRICVLRGFPASLRVVGQGFFSFNDFITFSVAELPKGITAEFTPNPVQPLEVSTLTITADGGVVPNTYTVFIQGQNENIGLTRTIALDLLIPEGFCP